MAKFIPVAEFGVEPVELDENGNAVVQGEKVFTNPEIEAANQRIDEQWDAAEDRFYKASPQARLVDEARNRGPVMQARS